ncbi:WD40-repeat-containing domain protein [Rhodotorula diobovata]|uniref:WD40-repeat-containing domain protein n=1 Tax=Rhodotorula diobovata TaxID=5288 RepID=A0A5C5G1G7_9BASI|nr:WD40-repeat-containing domain protein [Rhodotorula diobovata]
MDELTGLPLAFGKKAPLKKQTDTAARFETTKRRDPSPPPPVRPVTPIAQVPPLTVRLPCQQPTHNTALPPAPSNPAAPEGDTPDAASLSASPAAAHEDDIPITHEVILKDHVKTVSALSIDPAGARVVSGSYDYDCKLWDFGGMNASFKPFRTFEARAGHQVRRCPVLDVQFSTTGDSFLAATGATQVKLYDRDGLEICEFNKGDMYIRDLRNTDGHVAAVTALAWHPKNPSLFLTCSADSTLRIWDKDNRRKSKSVIVVKSKERGGKTKVSACCWSPDGKTIAAACEDGTVHMWSASGNFARPNASCEGAHEKGTTTSSIVFSPDGKHLVTRGGDGTLKLWNPKALKKPLAVASGLAVLNSETNACFSPDGALVLTGTAGAHAGVLAGGQEEERARELEREGGVGSGKVVVFRTEGLEKVREISVSPFSVVRVLWHPKINQILTGSADGSIHVLYSPATAIKGVTLAVTRAPKARQVDDFASASMLTGELGSVDRPIIAPHSLPMFKDDVGAGTSAGGRGGKRKRERERHDPQKTMKPMPPVQGPGKGGRIGAAATQHVVQGLVRNTIRDQDPREALLKYATADPNDNTWTKAWAATQPKPVFDDRPDPEDDVEEKRGR